MIGDVLRDFVLFADTDKYVGKCDSFKPPKLAIKEEDFRGAGMDTTMGIDLGMEKMESSFVLSGIDRAMVGRFGLELGLRSVVTARGAVVDPVTGFFKPVHHIMTGNIREADPGEWKPGERAADSFRMTLVHYKLTHTIPGIPLIEIDVINGVRMINGIDQLAPLRVATGR